MTCSKNCPCGACVGNLRSMHYLEWKPGCRFHLCRGLLKHLNRLALVPGAPLDFVQNFVLVARGSEIFARRILSSETWLSVSHLLRVSDKLNRLALVPGGIEEGSSCPLDVHKVLRQGPNTF